MRDSTGGCSVAARRAHCRGKRTYVRTSNFLRSILTANVPAGIEFEYARTNQGEYLAELYALAVSNPEFLHRTLPRAQIQWLKSEVFHSGQALEEVSRQAAVGEPQLSEFLERARCFLPFSR